MDSNETTTPEIQGPSEPVRQPPNLRDARRTEKKLRGRILRSLRTNDPRKVRDCMFRYANNFHVKFFHLVICNRRFPEPIRYPENELSALAQNLNIWRGTTDPIRVRYRRKSNGNLRRIFKYTMIDKASQRIASELVRCVAECEPIQMALPGRGIQRLTLEIKNKIEEGYTHVVRADIQDFFGSIEREAVRSTLNLPTAIVDNTILGIHKNLTDHTIGHITGEMSGLQGLPPGSAASPLVAEVMIAPMLRQLAAYAVYTYVDDIIILTRSLADALAAKRALEYAATHNPAGHFSLKYSEIRRAQQGFVFVGHNFHLRGSHVSVAPSRAARERIVMKLWCDKIENDFRNGNGPILSCEYIDMIRSTYPYFDGADIFCRDLRWFCEDEFGPEQVPEN